MNNFGKKFIILVGTFLLGRGIYGLGRYTARQEEIERLKKMQLDMRDIYIEVLEKKIRETEKEES